ncbi:SRPBCC family protein [Dasania marina]|uniref:aromatic ring-hydroxylating oxygenase subunit alpha n=1 Tax=Dasania marina TaxID=471499 RepID=UPI0030D9D0A8|tara:strand:- start:27071 stop:28234 length:1164 start_codon:yes stop_codon:yes gene_type:complete
MNSVFFSSEMSSCNTLDDLIKTAEMSVEDALTMPPSVYTSEDFHQLELEKLFRKEWVCVGRVEEIPKFGDFVTLDIAGQPVVAIRQKDNEIRAFANTCLHRCSKLLDDKRGNRPRINCPYHAWTYDMSGKLLAAPYMTETKDFTIEGKRLHELRVEVWEGFIYVTLDPSVESVSAQLAGLQEVYGQYRMADYITFVHDDEIWDGNWKILVENFIEGYHLFKIHKTSFEPISPTSWQFPQKGGDAYMYATAKVKPESGFCVAPETNTHLEGEWRETGSVGCVFPSHLIQITGDFLWYMSIQPEGTGKLRVRRGLSVAPERLAMVDESDRESFFAEMKALFDQVNTEDKVAVNAVSAGVQSQFAKQSQMSIHEGCLKDFSRYLAKKLAK